MEKTKLYCRSPGCQNTNEKSRLRTGLCTRHYMRELRGYQPEPPDDSVRFWSKVNKTENCWLWLGGQNGLRYGQVWLTKKKGHCVAHRFAYEEIVGKVPEGLVLDHICRVRHCVNPDHLEPVTFAENIRRGINSTRETCRNGHPFDGKNAKQRTCSICVKDNMKRFLARRAKRSENEQ